MRILGIGGSSHDFSAAVLEDGEIILAIEDERINRIKHGDRNWYSIPAQPSVDYCLNALNLSLKDFDYIYSNSDLDCTKKFIKQDIKYIQHHKSHAASSFYSSFYEHAALLVIDGHGSQVSPINSNKLTLETVSIGKGEKNQIYLEMLLSGNKKLTSGTWQYITENSLGSFYKVITDCLGFGMRGQGKTMGLSSYGTKKYYHELKEFITYQNDGLFQFDPYNGIFDWITEIIGANKNKFQVRADIAFAAQKIFEEIVVGLAKLCYKKTGLKSLCYGGGCALNGVANYRILNETPFENVFIYPAAGDNGLAVGAAYYGYFNDLGHQRKIPKTINFGKIAYKGKLYANEEILKTLDSYSVYYRKSNDLARDIGQKLYENNVIGLFQGASEVGPRALGNRSILADPSTIFMRDHINLNIKFRESFRPLAPIVPIELAKEYFDLQKESPFMLLIARIKEKYKNKLIGIEHIDGTARLQTIDKTSNPFLHKLLHYYYELSGYPILINTSFNQRGEPIVESPDDAIQAFIKTGIDILALDNYIVEKHSPWISRKIPGY